MRQSNMDAIQSEAMLDYYSVYVSASLEAKLAGLLCHDPSSAAAMYCR